MPKEQREQYEGLVADSIVFYPRSMAATNGFEFEALIHKYSNLDLPWSSALDLEGMHEERLDNDYVTLKYPIGEYSKQIGIFRKEAQEQEGKGSGADRVWKAHANTMYGVLACSHFPTNNFVAANLITAQARAEAFVLSQSLNAIQTITDGCTCRLDQIPACTFKECLRIKPDYPICRADDSDGIPFLDPSKIPTNDVEFAIWYRAHVRYFFDTDDPDFVHLIGAHVLEHKKTSKSGSTAFDGLAVDGSANYAKCTQNAAGEWQVEDLAARSYGKKSKARLAKWMVDTYSSDCLNALAPITCDTGLLGFKEAAQKARKVLDQDVQNVVFPLGLEHTKILCYRAIKPSSFVFETPEQRAAVVKQLQKFEDATGAGLDILCLRRGYKGRRAGSLMDLAESIYEMIREGKDNLTKALNLNKKSRAISNISRRRLNNVRRRKGKANEELQSKIDSQNIHSDAMIMTLIVGVDDLRQQKPTPALLHD